MRPVPGWIAIALALSCGFLALGQTQASSSASSQNTTSQVAFLKKYCITCHNQSLRTAGLVLDAADLNHLSDRAEVWEKVIRKLRTGTMPPAGAPRPDRIASNQLASFLEKEIDAAESAHPNPGQTEAIHRLNRTEYQNAVRDMLALDIDAATLLPADDQSYGFDNIAGVLKMSPTLLERYMGAAREISRLVVGASQISPSAETYRLRSDLSQYQQMDGLPFGTRGGTAIRHNFPQEGEYIIKVELLDLFTGAQVREPHQLEIAVDGERVKVFTLAPRSRAIARPPPQENSKPGEPPKPPQYTPEELQALGFGGKPPEFQVNARVKAGPHIVTATFIKKTSALPESIRQPFDRPHGEGDFLMYEPHLGTVTITGPSDPKGVRDTPSRNRVFTCVPSKLEQEAPCATQILTTLARRAYRRPVTNTEVTTLLKFYNEGRASGSFDAGIEKALRALLVSPDFLYRVEADSTRVGTSAVRRLTALELASRLSFFLWSSIPDDELIDLANQGKLEDPVILERQVRRMLKDDRSAALAANFAGQWLRLRNVAGAFPNDALFPNFSENLRQDFVKEAELFFGSIVKENRSVVDLLTADYTFLNETLAKFYGISNVHGNEFRRVTLTDPNRIGLLGKASILTVTSYPNRTSPVARGKWILENILGAPPPPKPENVPDLPENGASGKARSLRELMVQHRANPACAGCHSRMDPLGFALENFDAVGRWRTLSESGEKVDASGVLPDGTSFNGPAELRAVLVKNREQFVMVAAEKLLVYALGRGLEYQDAPAIRQIIHRSEESKYSFESLVFALVKSAPFTLRQNSSLPLKAARGKGIQ